MEGDDWEPASPPPRGTRWARGADGSWIPLGRDDPEPEPPAASPASQVPTEGTTAGRRRVSWTPIAVIVGSLLLGVAWWGTLGVEVTFVYLTASPMLDFILLTLVSVAWCWFVWRLLNRR